MVMRSLLVDNIETFKTFLIVVTKSPTKIPKFHPKKSFPYEHFWHSFSPYNIW
jgi:hypothetical protein